MSKDARIFNTFPEIETLSDDGVFLVGQKINGVVKFRKFTKAGFEEQYINSGNTATVSNYDEFLTANNDALKTFIIFKGNEINLGSNTLNLQSNKSYFFNNTIITHSDDTKKIVSAIDITNFAITGRLTIKGTKLTTETNDLESGLYLVNCKNYTIDGVIIQDCKFCGIEFGEQNIPPAPDRRLRGKFSNISLYSNNFSMFIASGAEYNTFTNIIVVNNLNPLYVLGGNNSFINCKVLDNVKGVRLGPGGNHAHGAFIGCDINHNLDYNLYIHDVTLGENFNGCHFYGDNIPNKGGIIIENSAGIQLIGGHIDTYIEVINGASSGLNYITNNFIAGTYTNLVGNGVSKIVLRGNFEVGGPSTLNTISSSYVNAVRNSVQTLANGDNLIFNIKNSDILNTYNNSNGVFTAPYTGLYNINFASVISGTNINSSSTYVVVMIDNTEVHCYLQCGLVGNTAIIDGNTEVYLTAGQTINLVIQLGSATGTQMEIDGGYIIFRKVE